VITEAMPSVRSVALGLWVGTGSRDEVVEQAGVSHFLEHLLFKGTERYSAIELNEQFDAIGAAFNAATSKETTHVHARFLDEHTERAFDLMGEMFLSPILPPDEVDSERQVVIEEIAMYEDEPQDRVHDVLDAAVFGEHPLGRRVLGAAEVIGSISVPDISGYHQARYRGANIVVAAAGSVDHAQVVELAERFLSPDGGDGAGEYEPPAGEPTVSFMQKDTEQYHICFGGPGIDRNDDRRFTARVLNTIFGGSSSSRLFTEVREKRGLAYAVGSYSESYRDAGMVAMYVGTREANVEEAVGIVGAELGKLCTEPVGDEELARAKESVKGRVVLAEESTLARMSRLASGTLFDVPILSLDELIERVDAVTADDILELARDFYSPDCFSAACIGKNEETFRGALGPVSEALAAA
jgi:predicted Zn-dependent peptidase